MHMAVRGSAGVELESLRRNFFVDTQEKEKTLQVVPDCVCACMVLRWRVRLCVCLRVGGGRRSRRRKEEEDLLTVHNERCKVECGQA